MNLVFAPILWPFLQIWAWITSRSGAPFGGDAETESVYCHSCFGTGFTLVAVLLLAWGIQDASSNVNRFRE